ncbi:T-lymphocyte activation antigen CD80 [Tenrec ecaudatus]|uniref:T-lymphocyte activation antigen CD80 n=1 Tax=Tenrec ecaudatus TaxID=94439 RepID=UPI003F5AB99B
MAAWMGSTIRTIVRLAQDRQSWTLFTEALRVRTNGMTPNDSTKYTCQVVPQFNHVQPNCASQLTKRVKEMAVLPCAYSIPSNQLTKFRIYWQKDDEVVLTITSGNIKVWPAYENRTIPSYSPDNLSIVIMALRLSDKGQYMCIVQKNDTGSYRVEHKNLVELFIIADFPTPIIADLGNISEDSKKILCSTSGGFPEPSLSWLENGEELNATNQMVSQDPQTELYNVSSELHFNMTRNRTVICVVKYGDKNEVSQTFHWIIPMPPPDNPFPSWGISLIIIALFVISGIITYCTLYYFPRDTETSFLIDMNTFFIKALEDLGAEDPSAEYQIRVILWIRRLATDEGLEQLYYQTEIIVNLMTVDRTMV